MGDSLIRLLFEDLPLLLLAEVAALAVVLAAHRRWMTARSRRMVWMSLALCGLLIAIQKLVVTDREALRDMVRTMARAVEQGDVAALGERFDDEIILGSNTGKEAVLQHVHLRLQRYDVNEARVSGFQIEIEGDAATVAFQAVCDLLGVQANPYYSTLTQWQLRCVRHGDGWKVRSAKYEFGFTGLGR